MDDGCIYQIQNITKAFPGVVALDNISLNVRRGEILAIVGENGAGKSTLMNILSGVYPPTSGALVFDGKAVSFTSPGQAQQIGIAMIHQELSLSNALSIAENIFQARLPKRANGLIDSKKLYAQSTQLLEEVGLGQIDPHLKVRDINVSQQQQVEISKALSLNASLLILDEPTSALTPTEANVLHEIMQKLRAKGITMLYISHKLEEVMKISDRVAVFRDGQFIDTLVTKEAQISDMISLMVGREYSAGYKRKKYLTHYADVQPALEVKNLKIKSRIKDVSFTLHKGEVLGITGLVGAGRSEVLQAVFGADAYDSGVIKVDGKEVAMTHPSVAINCGMGLVPEGRKQQGLFLNFSVMKNMSAVYLRHMLSRAHLIQHKKETAHAQDFCKRLRVKTPSLEQKITSLSGGNQQKVIIARWLMNQPQILFLDEPTQGIDIGAKNEIYDIIDQLASSGVGVIVVSSEMQETIGLCDRIIVMYEGAITGELLHEQATETEIMKLMSGRPEVLAPVLS